MQVTESHATSSVCAGLIHLIYLLREYQEFENPNQFNLVIVAWSMLLVQAKLVVCQGFRGHKVTEWMNDILCV